MPESELGNPSTDSERLFEQYLTAHGYTDWTHERPIPGKPTTPDYRLRFGGREFFFEVKEFVDEEPPENGEGDFYDPYRPLREKLNRSVRQFKAYKEFPCSVVMADPHQTFVDIEAPEVVLGTMLGNVGYQMPIGVRPGPENPPKQVFTGGGKMVDAKRQQPQNTTISAIVIVSEYPVQLRKLEIALDKRKKELGRSLMRPAFLSVTGSVPTSNLDCVLRVAVYENPYARILLSRDLFRGSFDERWGVDGEVIRRVYVGDELCSVEEELEKCDRRSPIQRLMDKRTKDIADGYAEDGSPESEHLRSSMKKLDPAEAEAIKKEIREAAKGGPGQPEIDLKKPENTYSVWFRNGPQGFLCNGTGADLDSAWRLIGQYHLGNAVILHVSTGLARIILLESAEG